MAPNLYLLRQPPPVFRSNSPPAGAQQVCDLHRRLKVRLAQEGTNFQTKVEELLIRYLDGPEADREEIARQVALAKEIMQEYAPAMRELAR